MPPKSSRDRARLRSTAAAPWLASISLILALPPGGLAAQEPATQPALDLDVLELSIGGRLHTQFNTTSVDGHPPSRLFIRRARLEIAMQVDERISGRLQPDFGSDDVELKDAYMQLTFSPTFEVRVGKAYRPFGLLEQTSSMHILPVERGLRIRGVSAVDEYAATSGLGYSNRDIGIQLMGEPENGPLGLAWAAGVFRGPLHNLVGDQDSYQFAARATVSPAADVRLGAGWSSRHFTTGPAEGHDLERGHAFEVDLEYGGFDPGFHLLAEVSMGELDPHRDADFMGAQAWLAWRTEELGRRGSGVALEPLLRLSWADTEVDGPGSVIPGGALFTPGLNVRLGPLNRLMIDWDIWRGEGDTPDGNSFKAMFQLGF